MCSGQAAQAGRYFPLSLGSEGSCQIGGNLSTNAGGLAALRYGVARELVLGLEVVLPDGRVLDGLKSLRKDNTGYDLRHLFIGAEGTLGVITAASLKLFPVPRTVATAFVAVESVAAAVALLGRLREAPATRSRASSCCRVSASSSRRGTCPACRDPFGEPHDWYVLCEIASAREDPGLRTLLEDALGAAMSDGGVRDAVLAESVAQRDALWRVRESVPEAQRREGASIKHDVSVPVAAATRLRDAGDRGGAGNRSRRAHARLRARGRRQPALQRDPAGGRRGRRIFLRSAMPSPRPSMRRSASSAAASARSTGSDSSSVASSRATRARSTSS